MTKTKSKIPSKSRAASAKHHLRSAIKTSAVHRLKHVESPVVQIEHHVEKTPDADRPPESYSVTLRDPEPSDKSSIWGSVFNALVLWPIRATLYAMMGPLSVWNMVASRR
jgi:hypothetical protein